VRSVRTWLPDHVVQALHVEARSQRLSMSGLIRKILTLYVKNIREVW
jgi:hypothetical protein